MGSTNQRRSAAGRVRRAENKAEAARRALKETNAVTGMHVGLIYSRLEKIEAALKRLEPEAGKEPTP